MTDQTDNVAIFPGVTPLDFDANVMLDAAKKADLESVVILGYTKEGAEFFSSSTSSGPDVLWMLERARMELLRVADDD